MNSARLVADDSTSSAISLNALQAACALCLKNVSIIEWMLKVHGNGANTLIDTPNVYNFGLGAGRTHSNVLIVVDSVLGETISYLSRPEM